MLSATETEQLCHICLSVGIDLLELAIRASNNTLHWPTISKFELSETTIHKYAEYVNWRAITRYNQLSPALIREHEDQVDWYEISIHYKLSDVLMREWIDHLDVFIICHTQTLTQSFIHEYESRFDSATWFFISIYQPITIELICKYRDDIMMSERVVTMINDDHASRALMLKNEVPICVVQIIHEYL
ncbi:hypothetical protein GN244_ATG16821 [Phytophthora infestans]|uniref:Uncharacterized protein n=1 Tax=Phytophthora infestans TaxID=4787 RepID=A0A833S2R8_PHYIN|nr:hypothetical protein GN244_ATG16821 [Phytophthora infestans]KAF4141787.1 hypothetical protein GN958_ATG09032 [Phytophthora infestans]